MWHQKAKGPPDGPPIFLIFVEKLNCPQSQAYQSISPVGTGLSLTDRALGVSLGTSIGNYSPLIAPQPVKLKIKCRKACRFESGHRHHGVRAKSAPLKIRQLKMSCRIFRLRSLAPPLIIYYYSEHSKRNGSDKRTKDKHQKGNARRQRDQGGEKKKQKSGWKSLR